MLGKNFLVGRAIKILKNCYHCIPALKKYLINLLPESLPPYQHLI